MFAVRYKGIYLPKMRKSNKAAIAFQGNKYHLGVYATPAEAAHMYDEARIFLVSQQNQELSKALYDMSCCDKCRMSFLALGHLQKLLLCCVQGKSQ